MTKLQSLSRREREMMDVVYRAERATAAEIRDLVPNPPSYSAVRATLRILEEKGLLKHEYDGKRYVYVPRVARDKAVQGALDHLVTTFFQGSAMSAVMTLLEQPGVEMSEEDVDRMTALIARARKEGR
jgi:predicted transcriptional regulator